MSPQENLDMSSSVSRRQFLQWIASFGALVGLGALGRVAQRKTPVLRPPGAVPQELFTALCIKCRKCEQVCPQDVIRPLMLIDSALGSGTPTLDFYRGGCDFCMDCVMACPTGALRLLEDEALVIGLARVLPEACIAWDWGACTACYDVCPQEAISLDEHDRPVVDANRCNGCGLCEYECIGAAVRSYSHSSGRGIVVFPLGAG